jgi:hypothetical protein
MVQRLVGQVISTSSRWVVYLVLGAALTPSRARAQDIVDPSDTARFRLGPLRFTPSISVTNLGVDTNVFNEVQNPKQDTTASIGPATDLWLRVGPSRLSGHAGGQYLYFDQYANQRAWNTAYDARWELPMGRITPYMDGTYSDSKSRPGYEIDSRVRLQSQNVGIGTELKMSGRATLIAVARRARVDFANDQTFVDTDLSLALNMDTNAEELKLRYRLTSLTTFVVDAQALQDRFPNDRLKNANSIKVMPGFEMKPSALVSGKVFVGLRRFGPLNAAVPDYTGPIAAVDAKFTARRMQIGATVARDLSYSYQAVEPYYILTDVGLSVTERLGESWDVVARGGRGKLDYKRLVPITPLGSALDETLVLPPSRETIYSAGFGVGYRFGRTMRLGIDAAYSQRHSSDLALRDYSGLRAGASVTYGLPQ